MSEYARLVIAADSTQVRGAERDLTRLEQQSGKTESAAVGMAAKIGAAFAALKIADHISDVVQLASRYDQMGLVMQTVGENTGRSAAELAVLDQALQDTGISALQSRNNLIRMMSANIDLSQATELASLAQNAAVVANINSSEAFERLIKGIQSAEKETLETMGLNVNFAQSYEKLAAQLGKNADNLTATEKVQAGVNAAMEAGANIAGVYDVSMDNAGKRLASASRHLENFQIALGSSAQTEFGYVVDAYSDSLKYLGENADTVAQIIETGLYVAVGLGATALTQKAYASASAMLASRALAAEELRLAQAQAASTGTTLNKLRATFQATGATTGLTAAISAHEAAERRLAAAQAASVSIGRGLLGIMGGPAGLAVTAGMVALSFVDWSYSAEEAARKNIALRAETELLTRAVQELDAAQARQVLQRMEEPYKAAQHEARGYAARVEYLNMQISNHPGSAKVDEWRRSLVEAEGNLSTVNQAIDEQEQKMRDLNARIDENTAARNRNNEAVDETDLTGQKWLASLQRQADFAGKLTELQKVNIAIEKGYAGTLSETDQALARNNAKLIDQANAVKASSKATDKLADSYKPVIAGLERQIALYGETGEEARQRHEIESGALKGVAAKHTDYILGLARELDAKRDLTEQEKLRIQLLRESGQLRAANDAQFELEYAGKILEYEKQGNVEAAERLRTLKAIREIQMNADQAPGTVEGVTQAPSSGGLDASVGGPWTEMIRLQLEAQELEVWRATELEKQKAFLEAKAINEETHAERVANIHQQSADAVMRIQGHQTIAAMTMAQGLTNDMMTLMRQAGMENSAFYKAMFLAQQALAVGQAVISTELAAVSAMAPPPLGLGPVAGLPYSNLIRGMGYASVAMIGAQTAVGLSSFEGGGHTGYGPRVGGLDGKGGFMAMVHPNETIIDHTKSGKGGGQGGAPQININNRVIVEGQPGMSEEESRAQGEQVAGAMRATIISTLEKESRQGGLLWNMYGGGR